MDKLEVFWSGRIPLERVSWTIDTSSVLILTPELELERERVWKDTLKNYPDSYDGNLIVLLDYVISGASIQFQVGSITFSRILTLERKGVKPAGYGCLGFQAILFSSDRKYVLIGERSKDSLYCPLHYAFPGGMLEVDDTQGTFEQACMREIREEVSLELSPQKYLAGLVGELHGNVGVAAMIEATAKESMDPETLVPGNEEWTEQALQWISIDELSHFTTTNSLEGPVFLRSEQLLENGT